MAFPPELAVAPLILYNQPLPFVNEAEHLGHLRSVDEFTSHDVDLKRGDFVGKYQSLRQELRNQSSVVYLKLINLSYFYGHCLWDYSQESAERLWRTWNTLVRDTYNLPYATHRFLSRLAVFITETFVCSTD